MSRMTPRAVAGWTGVALAVVAFFPPVLWHSRGKPMRVANWDHAAMAPRIARHYEEQAAVPGLDSEERQRLMALVSKYRRVPVPREPRPGLLELVPDTRFATWFAPSLYYLDGGNMVFWEMLLAELFAVGLAGGGLLTWAVRRRRRIQLSGPG